MILLVILPFVCLNNIEYAINKRKKLTTLNFLNLAFLVNKIFFQLKAQTENISLVARFAGHSLLVLIRYRIERGPIFLVARCSIEASYAI